APAGRAALVGAAHLDPADQRLHRLGAVALEPGRPAAGARHPGAGLAHPAPRPPAPRRGPRARPSPGRSPRPPAPSGPPARSAPPPARPGACYRPRRYPPGRGPAATSPPTGRDREGITRRRQFLRTPRRGNELDRAVSRRGAVLTNRTC